MIKQEREILDVDDYNDYASEMWTSFLESFTIEKGLIREVTENDAVDDSIAFLYTNKGAKLAEKMRDLLYKVGYNEFGEDSDIEICSSLFIEY